MTRKVSSLWPGNLPVLRQAWRVVSWLIPVSNRSGSKFRSVTTSRGNPRVDHSVRVSGGIGVLVPTTIWLDGRGYGIPMAQAELDEQSHK